MSDFTEELTELLNRYSIENASNTPDHILAEYMLNSLDAYERATQERDAWYAMNPEPGTEWASKVPEYPSRRPLTAAIDDPREES